MERRSFGGNYGGDRGGGRSFGGGFDSGRTPPVNVGDELDVKIEAIGEKGDGVAKKDGFVIFVPNVQKDEDVKIRVTRVLRKVGFGEVIGRNGSAPAKQEQKPAEDADSYSAENDSENFGEEQPSGDNPETTENSDSEYPQEYDDQAQ